ncbi:MAG: hypothetical protein LBB22_03270 [Treponema sp.]|jgi:hypothetical protein|nr:hypothetical protein [Treponema sp.]
MRVFIYFLTITLFVSCATRGATDASASAAANAAASAAASAGLNGGGMAGGEFADLPAGALAYINIDVKLSRKLLDDVLTRYKLNTKTVISFFDRTDRAAAAVYAENKRFLLIGYGKNYPAGLSSFSLFFNPSWEKRKSAAGKKYWYSAKNRFTLLMQKNKTHISNGDPFFSADMAETPENFALLNDGSGVSVWMADTEILNRLLVRMDIPITIPASALFISAVPQDSGEENWNITFRLETWTQSQAKGLISVFSMLRNALNGNYISNKTAAAAFVRTLFSEPPALDGSAIVLKCTSISRSELAGLAASFPVYLK